MLHTKIKQFILLLGLILPATWCGAHSTYTTDGISHIQIKEAHVQGIPKGSFIQATINGHYLSIIFTENLGQVTVEVSKMSGGESQIESTPTPNGVNFYIYDTGSYVVTFYLSNGDEYYGEFDVTD